MKAREGSQRFSHSKKRLAPGEVLRKLSRRREVVCEKLSRRLQEFGKKLLGVQSMVMFGQPPVVSACICACEIAPSLHSTRFALNFSGYFIFNLLMLKKYF